MFIFHYVAWECYMDQPNIHFWNQKNQRPSGYQVGGVPKIEISTKDPGFGEISIIIFTKNEDFSNKTREVLIL